MRIHVYQPFAVRLGGRSYAFAPGPAEMPDHVFEHWYAQDCLRGGYFAPVFEEMPESGGDPNAMTVRQLRELCEKASLNAPANARKADLIALLCPQAEGAPYAENTEERAEDVSADEHAAEEAKEENE